MQYDHIVKGTFRARPNRFIALVEIDGREEVCHVKNTGRCRELLIPGATVYLDQSDNPKRKTAYDLVAVEKGTRLINMDAQAPNRVFAEWAAGGGFLPHLRSIRPEVTFGASRFDFRLETEEGKVIWVEVKGVTLEENGLARFPDAPTERGVKHIQELQRAAEAGDGAVLFFVVQMEGIQSVQPNDATHLAFGAALRQAAKQGVQVLARGCRVEPSRLEIAEEIPVVL